MDRYEQKRLIMKMAVVLCMSGMSAQAAVLSTGDVLTINNGVYSYDSYGIIIGIALVSWFVMDLDGNLSIASTERNPITGLSGVVMGISQAPGDIDQSSLFGLVEHHTTPRHRRREAPQAVWIWGLGISMVRECNIWEWSNPVHNHR